MRYSRIIGTVFVTLLNVTVAYAQISTPIPSKATDKTIEPSVVTMDQLPFEGAVQRIIPPPPRLPRASAVPEKPTEPITHSVDVQVDERDVFVQPSPQQSLALASANSFTTEGEIDIAGATDGKQILTTNNAISVYNLMGALIHRVSSFSFWCSGTPILTSCFQGFDGDDRVRYDTGSKRWIITALWVFGVKPVKDVIAVSQTSDAMGAWNVYEFPACGANDTWDGSDQPHAGFNTKWIVVNSACSSSPTSLIVIGMLSIFDKANLYRGGALTLNGTWFEITDPFDSRTDNPVLTYNTNAGQEFLAHVDVNSQGFVIMIYSNISGAVNAPVLHSRARTIVTSFKAGAFFGGLPAADAPACTACINSEAATWVHSSSVWNFKNGTVWVLATIVMKDPLQQSATQVLSVAANPNNGNAKALLITGDGALGSEIGMPLVTPTISDNNALIVYDSSTTTFAPGVKAVIWDISTNKVTGKLMVPGQLTPDVGFDRDRWLDFIDDITPIPGTSQMVIGASIASPSVSNPQHATYWATVTP
jgi:hypothetical protein